MERSFRWQVEDVTAVKDLNRDAGSAPDIPGMLRQLHILQVALELQNEELRTRHWDLSREVAVGQLVAEMSSDAIFTLMPSGSIQFWNSAAEILFGYSASELVGTNAARHVELDPCVGALRWPQVSQLSIVDRHIQVQGRDGQERLVVMNARSLWDMTRQEPTGLLLVIRDIDEIREARKQIAQREAEAVHASRLSTMGEMVSILAHEVSQPLTVITDAADRCSYLLREGDLSISELDVPISMICDQAIRANSIIQNLRQFVVRSATTHTPVDLNYEIDNALNLLREQIEARDIDIRLSLSESLPLVLADSLQIQQVFVNLVQNSVEAMKDVSVERREIVIVTSERENQIRASVRDAGQGLVPEVAGRLFEPNVSTKDKGLGMGLAICDRIVSAHGGKITVTSNETEGVTFEFSLPIVETDCL